jgi:methyl-accepting chemotaxis protein
MNMNISRSLLAFGLVVTLGLASAVGLKVYIFERLKVNGPVYQEIVYGKDLIADILPPPLYVVESYMLANEIYAHPTIGAENLEKIARLESLYEERRAYWQASTLEPALNSKLQDDVLVKGDVYWSALKEQYIPALESGDPNAALIALGTLYEAFHTHDRAVNELVALASTYLEATEARARSTDNFYSTITLTASVASILLFLAGIYLFRRRAIQPLEAMEQYMGNLARGDYSKEVPYSDRRDEIGDMAQSVVVFRQAAMDRKNAREQSEKERAEIHRLEQEAAVRKAEEDAERIRVIDALTTGLENLSAGNLGYRITGSFAADYEKLRTEFNTSVEALCATMNEITATTDAVRMASS